jgi:hypothetical protein
LTKINAKATKNSPLWQRGAEGDSLLTKPKIPPSLPFLKGGAFFGLAQIYANSKKIPLFGKEGLGEIRFFG